MGGVGGTIYSVAEAGDMKIMAFCGVEGVAFRCLEDVRRHERAINASLD